MHSVDYVVFAAYLIGSLGLGLAFARRQRGEGEFFVAGRSMRWVPIGLSVMVTAFSAMNYVAFPGEVSRHGLYVLLCLPVFVLVAFPVTRVIMPYYHGLGLTSAYEVLERRFDVRVRCLASGLFIVWRLLWMAVALFVPSKVLSLMLGWDLWVVVAVAGAVAAAYTAAGGMRAVIWTDVAQFVVLVGGLVVALAVAAARVDGGLAGIVRAGAEGGVLKPFHPFDPQVLSPDPTVRITLWSCLVGTFVAFLARYGADQVVVQRYFAARSLRDAQRGFWLNVAAALVALSGLALLGLAMRAGVGATGGKVAGGPLGGFAAFVASMPAGVCGLLVAGLFAASMSSVDSGINSCSAAYETDFHRRLFARGGHPEGSVGRSRVLAVVFGAVATVGACTVPHWGPSIFVIANRVIHGLGGPLLAIFVLAMFSRRANGVGVFAGGVLGALGSVWVSFGVKGLALHYYVVTNLVGTMVLCWVLSFLAGRPSPEQLAWTWRGRRAG